MHVLDRANALLGVARVGDAPLLQTNAPECDEVSGHPRIRERNEISQLPKDEIKHRVGGFVIASQRREYCAQESCFRRHRSQSARPLGEINRVLDELRAGKVLGRIVVKPSL